MSTAGEKIRMLRVSKRWSLEDLAKFTSLHKTYIWELENRPNKKIDMEKLATIAEVFGVTVSSLVDQEVVPEEDAQEKGFFRKFKKLDERDKKIIDDIMKSLGQHKS